MTRLCASSIHVGDRPDLEDSCTKFRDAETKAREVSWPGISHGEVEKFITTLREVSASLDELDDFRTDHDITLHPSPERGVTPDHNQLVVWNIATAGVLLRPVDRLLRLYQETLLLFRQLEFCLREMTTHSRHIIDVFEYEMSKKAFKKEPIANIKATIHFLTSNLLPFANQVLKLLESSITGLEGTVLELRGFNVTINNIHNAELRGMARVRDEYGQVYGFRVLRPSLAQSLVASLRQFSAAIGLQAMPQPLQVCTFEDVFEARLDIEKALDALDRRLADAERKYREHVAKKHEQTLTSEEFSPQRPTRRVWLA
ncbi:hypothetical protein B0H67DRAFT_391965 [Lasiosphaeris hirsuta]|uniref:Uncharacterized protein n=1 Tax=Lasiosphaeris hirsuta TaxID=260670 RepID=A0AA39ZSF2_9PEZI|nr:hypothetical protein B0H67DRAFT_391965 [Lasiosphaeris hirsuta]